MTALAPHHVATQAPTPVDRVATLVRAGGTMSIGALLASAGQIWPDGTSSDRISLAVAAAMALRPATDRDKLETRLTQRARELEGTAAES